ADSTGPALTGNVEVGATVTAKPGVGENIHLGWRISGAGSSNGLNGYQLYLKNVSGGPDTWQIFRRDNGVTTSLSGGPHSFPGPAPQFSAGDKFLVITQGLIQ